MQELPKVRHLILGSLLLLIVAYVFFGWQWASWQEPWRNYWLFERYPQSFWPTAYGLSLIGIGLFTQPFAAGRSWLKRVFESDSRMFLASIAIASLSVLLLIHMAIVAEALLIGGVILLARFDLQMARICGWPQFLILAMMAMASLAFGGFLYRFHPLVMTLPWRFWPNG